MIIALADNILSPLGHTTAQNLHAVLQGVSHIALHTSVHGEPLQEPFWGSLMPELPILPGYSAFESMCITSAQMAIADAEIDAAADDCIFVISTTKGNIFSSPALSAQKVARYFGNQQSPVVVSTACTSGVSAQIVAHRLLLQGTYAKAVVIGCDVQCEFIVSGFQSFKALADAPCLPFDAERKGLNAGEAAATLVLASVAEKAPQQWCLWGGSIHNDANHISGPSRTAEGSWRCLEDAKSLLPEPPAFVSLHGTGTAYNDEMESLAVYRANLSQTPISALKGFYGHTMGAAGLLETILSIHAANEGIVLPCKGFSQQGTTYPVSISNQVRTLEATSFIKLLSGFGGVNAAVAWSKRSPLPQQQPAIATTTLAEIHLTSADDLVQLYRERVGDYPKFFKMDTLARLGFLAVELLLQKAKATAPHVASAFDLDAEHTAIVLANHSASIKNDSDYQHTIEDKTNYYPSPALFVYTLPNIVAGEIAIRHHLYGETAFYILPSEQSMPPLIEATFSHSNATTVIAGWLECTAADHYQAHLKLIKRVE